MADGSAGMTAFEAAGEGPVLLFMHGIGGNRHVFGPQLAYFAARGWRCIAWDAPG